MRELIDPFHYGGAVFRVGLATTEEERASCYTLRFLHFCLAVHAHDVVRLNPDDYPDGLERDDADKTGFLVMVTMTVEGITTTVGTFRFNKCSIDNPGTVGHPFGDGLFELPDTHRGEEVRPEEVFDAGRWVGHDVITPHGDQMVNIGMLLVEAGKVLSKELGIRFWAVIILTRSARTLRRMGWPIDLIVPGTHQYCNLESEGCLIPMDPVYPHPCPRLGAKVKRVEKEK